MKPVALHRGISKLEGMGRAFLLEEVSNALFDDRSKGHVLAGGKLLRFAGQVVGDFYCRFHMGTRIDDTVLPYYRITVLPYYRITVLPYYKTKIELAWIAQGRRSRDRVLDNTQPNGAHHVSNSLR